MYSIINQIFCGPHLATPSHLVIHCHHWQTWTILIMTPVYCWFPDLQKPPKHCFIKSKPANAKCISHWKFTGTSHFTQIRIRWILRPGGLLKIFVTFHSLFQFQFLCCNSTHCPARGPVSSGFPWSGKGGHPHGCQDPGFPSSIRSCIWSVCLCLCAESLQILLSCLEVE